MSPRDLFEWSKIKFKLAVLAADISETKKGSVSVRGLFCLQLQFREIEILDQDEGISGKEMHSDC